MTCIDLFLPKLGKRYVSPNRLVFLFFYLWGASLMAQGTISGTFSPANKYNWVIVYRLSPEGQSYTADTAITNGKFSLELPENSPNGVYRFIYALPQEEYYFDVLINGKEKVQLHFDETEGITFLASEENKMFNSYFRDIHDLELQVIQSYSEETPNIKEFKEILKKLKSTQATYEKRSEGLMAQHFVKANAPYVPSPKESVFEYVKNKKANYFNTLDLKNPILQASGYLTDKISNYVFTALPVQEMTPLDTQEAMLQNLGEIHRQMQEIAPAYQFHVYYTLWKQAVSLGHEIVSDTVYDKYLRPLAEETDNQGVIEEIKVYRRLQLGAIAPEITWNQDKISKKLSELDGSDYYILVFWSSTCSHCLHDIPKLHEKLKGRQNIKVVAIGLEDSDNSWETESGKLTDFEHVFALGKWENEYALLYGIERTPTYFILDAEKRILAKPEESDGVVEFLEGI